MHSTMFRWAFREWWLQRNRKSRIPQLHLAAMDGDNSRLSDILDEMNGVGINATDDFGRTALHWAAARGGYLGMSSLTCEEEIRPCMKDIDGLTPLHEVAWRGDGYSIRGLLQYNGGHAEWNIVDNQGRTALHWAAEYGNFSVAEELLKAGVDCEIEDQETDTPLHRAAFQHHERVVSLLLQHKSSLAGKQNKLRNTPLHRAIQACILCKSESAYSKSMEVCSELISHMNALYIQNCDDDAEPHLASQASHRALDFQNFDGDTALHLASRAGHPALVAELLRKGANYHEVKNVKGELAIDSAIDLDTRDEVIWAFMEFIEGWDSDVSKSFMIYLTKTLISKSIHQWSDTDGARGKIGEMMIKWDANNGSSDIITTFMNYENLFSILLTALYNGVCNGNLNMVALLLKHVNPKIHDSDRWDLLRGAMELANLDMIKMLLDVTPHEQDDSAGLTILRIVKYGRPDVVQMMVDSGKFDLNASFNGAPQVLFMAICLERIDVLKILLESGRCDTNVEYRGHSPLFLALCLGHEAVVKTLLDFGVNSSVEGHPLTDEGYNQTYIGSRWRVNSDLEKRQRALSLFHDHGGNYQIVDSICYMLDTSIVRTMGS